MPDDQTPTGGSQPHFQGRGCDPGPIPYALTAPSGCQAALADMLQGAAPTQFKQQQQQQQQQQQPPQSAARGSASHQEDRMPQLQWAASRWGTSCPTAQLNRRGYCVPLTASAAEAAFITTVVNNLSLPLP